MPDSPRDALLAAPKTTPKPVRLADCRVPEFLVERVELTFGLDPAETLVRSRLEMRRNPASADQTGPLRLDGDAAAHRSLPHVIARGRGAASVGERPSQ